MSGTTQTTMTLGRPCIYPRREGCIIHPDDLELCDSTLWSNPQFFRALQEYHKTVSDVRGYIALALTYLRR